MHISLIIRTARSGCAFCFIYAECSSKWKSAATFKLVGDEVRSFHDALKLYYENIKKNWSIDSFNIALDFIYNTKVGNLINKIDQIDSINRRKNINIPHQDNKRRGIK